MPRRLSDKLVTCPWLGSGALGAPRVILAAVLICLSRLVWAQAALPVQVRAALDSAGIPAAKVALYVHDTTQSEPVLAHNATQAVNPASVMKLVTTYAALELLGPAYQWKTEAHGVGLAGATVRGDLILKGYGDPKLTYEDIWLLLRSLRNRGVREIRGDLVVDNTYFETEASDPSRFDNQGHRSYNVLPQAFLPTFKAVNFYFHPDARERLVRIEALPELASVRVINKVQLRDGACPRDWREGITRDVRNGATQASVIFGGVYYVDCGEQDLSFSLLGYPQFTLALFQQLWTELGGRFSGRVRYAATPPETTLLVQRVSEPLGELVRDINKWSNNVMARQLLLTLGAEQAGAPGTTHKGSEAIKRWLALKGMSFPELVIENGAGLSRDERISAQHLGELLLAAHKSAVAPEYVASLPIVGRDGTMKKRLKDTPVAGNAHIKTGSLDGVRALAGYVLDAKGRRSAVVFVVNHERAEASQAAQDSLLEWVYHRPD